MKYYSEEHEWVEVEEGVAIVGISTYAAEQLGDITFVDLPAVGTEVGQGDSLTVIESVKAASDLYAHLSGKVKSVNKALADHPELINDSPEDEGWICRLSGIDESELENLMSEDEYREFVAGLDKD